MSEPRNLLKEAARIARGELDVPIERGHLEALEASRRAWIDMAAQAVAVARIAVGDRPQPQRRTA